MFTLQLWQAESSTLIWKQAAENGELSGLLFLTRFWFPVSACRDLTGTKADQEDEIVARKEILLSMMFIFEATAWQRHNGGRGWRSADESQINSDYSCGHKLKLNLFFKPNNNPQKQKPVNSGTDSFLQCKWTNISAKPSKGSNSICITHYNYTTMHTHTHTFRHPAHEYSCTNRFFWIIKWRK